MDTWIDKQTAKKMLTERGFAIDPTPQWCKQNNVLTGDKGINRVALLRWCSALGSVVIGQRTEKWKQ